MVVVRKIGRHRIGPGRLESKLIRRKVSKQSQMLDIRNCFNNHSVKRND